MATSGVEGGAYDCLRESQPLPSAGGGGVGGAVWGPGHLFFCAAMKKAASKTQTEWSRDYPLWLQLTFLQIK